MSKPDQVCSTGFSNDLSRVDIFDLNIRSWSSGFVSLHLIPEDTTHLSGRHLHRSRNKISKLPSEALGNLSQRKGEQDNVNSLLLDNEFYVEEFMTDIVEEYRVIF